MHRILEEYDWPAPFFILLINAFVMLSAFWKNGMGVSLQCRLSKFNLFIMHVADNDWLCCQIALYLHLLYCITFIRSGVGGYLWIFNYAIWCGRS